MEPNIVSNIVYEAIQPATLESEPITRSTVLYANQYSGMDEVPLTDPELLEVINSTTGTAGNNILVQLKKKMSTFRNGPWYIDSRNGLIYIHNRKYSDSTVYSYNYQYENGELLYASFRLVEISRPQQILGGIIDAVRKSVGIVQEQMRALTLQQLENNADVEAAKKVLAGHKYSDPVERWLEGKKVIEESKKSNVDAVTGASKTNEVAKLRSKSLEERKAAVKAGHETAYQNYDKNLGIDKLYRDNAQFRRAYDAYMEAYETLGGSNPQTQALKKEMIETSKNTRVGVGWAPELYEDYTIRLSVEVVTAVQTPTEAQKMAAINERVERFVKDNPRKRIQPGNVTNISAWKRVSPLPSMVPGNTSGHDMVTRHQATFTLHYTGLSRAYVRVRGDRLVQDVFGRYLPDNGPGSNALSPLNNAAANMGRARREKQIQATIRVVGNPILETGMQIDLQNVGKKYSGIWYIHTVSHSLEFGQGYICDVELSKQLPKANSEAVGSMINTQAYTLDDQEASPNNTTIRKNSVSTTSNKPRSKANSTGELSWKDALNLNLSSEELAVITTIASAQSDDSRVKSNIAQNMRKVAFIKMVSSREGKNYPTILKDNEGKYYINPDIKPDYSNKNSPRYIGYQEYHGRNIEIPSTYKNVIRIVNNRRNKSQ